MKGCVYNVSLEIRVDLNILEIISYDYSNKIQYCSSCCKTKVGNTPISMGFLLKEGINLNPA